MHSVYVLKSEKDCKLYVGCTSDFDKRIKEHNHGSVRSTKSRRPFVLVWKKDFKDKYEAYFIERFYKTAKGKKELLIEIDSK